MAVPLFDPRRLKAHASKLMASAEATARVFAAATSQARKGATPAQVFAAATGKAYPAAPQASGSGLEAGMFDCPSGSRPYRLFVPARPAARPALIVMLHGCGQTAEDFAAGTRMNAHAERAGAIVLYPVQVQSANAQRCWNWFNPAERNAGSGEAAILSGMVRDVAARHGVDPSRIFVAGLSAGGALAQALGAAYPDLFAAVGVHSGLACGAANDVPSALMAMRRGHEGQGHHRMRTIIFHGDGDTTVNAANADAIADQVAQTATTPPETEEGRAKGGLGYRRDIRRDRAGRIVLERWTVHGAGHAWSGGDTAGSFVEPRGPDASAAFMRFFLN
jgi:poly(hydroxyalkanoate) depolymerase family esterase